jgi:hypothetical protein
MAESDAKKGTMDYARSSGANYDWKTTERA